jgi:hypothetical protein
LGVKNCAQLPINKKSTPGVRGGVGFGGVGFGGVGFGGVDGVGRGAKYNCMFFRVTKAPKSATNS